MMPKQAVPALAATLALVLLDALALPASAALMEDGHAFAATNLAPDLPFTSLRGSFTLAFDDRKLLERLTLAVPDIVPGGYRFTADVGLEDGAAPIGAASGQRWPDARSIHRLDRDHGFILAFSGLDARIPGSLRFTLSDSHDGYRGVATITLSPLPAALPLLASAVALLGFAAWRRHRATRSGG